MPYYFLQIYANYVQIDFISLSSRRTYVEINLSIILPYLKYVKSPRIMPMRDIIFLPHCPVHPFYCHIRVYYLRVSVSAKPLLHYVTLFSGYLYQSDYAGATVFAWWTSMCCSGFSFYCPSFGRPVYIFPFLPTVLYCTHNVQHSDT